MTKTLRASVCFPQALHTSIKVAVATANPRVSLTDFVSRLVAASANVSDRAITAASDTLVYGSGRAVRCTITFPRPVADLANDRAYALGLSQSAFIAAVVAHKLNQNGKKAA